MLAALFVLYVLGAIVAENQAPLAVHLLLCPYLRYYCHLLLLFTTALLLLYGCVAFRDDRPP
jgi:hypothetical protein